MSLIAGLYTTLLRPSGLLPALPSALPAPLQLTHH